MPSKTLPPRCRGAGCTARTANRSGLCTACAPPSRHVRLRENVGRLVDAPPFDRPARAVTLGREMSNWLRDVTGR